MPAPIFFSLSREMKWESHPLCIFFYTLICFSIFLEFCSAADTLSYTQFLMDGETLVSSGQSFELGFFSPNGSKSRYLGTWYKNFPDIIVWVANRENPITKSTGALTISSNGSLVLLDQTKRIIWSSGSTRATENPVVQLLDSGNLVLRENSNLNPEGYIWKSFDFPYNTLLPNMKMGWNFSTGLEQYLTSWRTVSDPSPGDFTYQIEIVGLPQFVLRKGSEKKFRSGPWNGLMFGGIQQLKLKIFEYSIVYNADELYFSYQLTKNSRITRLVLNESGLVQRLVLSEGSTEWTSIYSIPADLCDNYGYCGANSICRIGRRPVCECLDGFIPGSEFEWEYLNWTNGCIRRNLLDCQEDEGFAELNGVKLPDLLEFSVNKRMNLEECRVECLKNCSCTAYTNSNVSGKGSGCLIWFGDLFDIREFADDSPQTIYIRMSASELALMDHSNQKKKKLLILVIASSAAGVLILGLLIWFIGWKKRVKRGSRTGKEDMELPLYDLATVASATNNFGCTNMIGKGGFGPVYKGSLPEGQEVAVKRLSSNSRQGHREFENEVILISKLQHRNLVKLMGYCTEGEERILIYEYMPNKSLDYFIFDKERSITLPWQKRFDILMGVARGLLYLHQDSRLRIIHRDLKTSNILLDDELNPKISDFGIARIFEIDQAEARTKQVIGTYGYMSPEYAVDGKFSVKSDVFSFGVLLLEVVSGKKNRGFCHPDHHHNLLGHAWLLWNKNQTLELVDECLEESLVESQALRSIQVGLLCIQKLPKDRPSMSSVALMLVNEEATLPDPKQPGFFMERSSWDCEEGLQTENAVTVTTMEGR